MQNNVGIYASQISGHLYGGPYGAYDSLASVTIGAGGVLSVTFSGIPSGYKHLQIRAIWRDNRSNSGNGSYADMTFNGDTGNNYAYHQLQGYGTGISSGGNANYAAIEVTRIADAGTGANTFGASIIDILDYANTNKNKTIRALGGYDNNGTGATYLYSGFWNSTSPVTSLKIQDSGGTLFSQYSSFALYGVK